MKAHDPKLLRISKAAHELGLHPFTVRKWIKQGKIAAIWIGQEARVPRSEIERLVGRTDGRLIVLYGRVSGQGQKGDLDTQLARLSAWAQTERAGKPTLVLWDIGSGLKATRRQLQRLLKLVREDQVVLFDSFGVTLTILEPGEDKTGEQELTDDLLALIASFSGRLYGMRSHKQKELLKCAQAVINNP